MNYRVEQVVPTLNRVALATDSLPAGVQVGSDLMLEYEGHKVSYRVTQLSPAESVAAGAYIRLDLEVTKIHY